jgi:hypothetical protein
VAGDGLARVCCVARAIRVEAHNMVWLAGGRESSALDRQWSVTEEKDRGASHMRKSKQCAISFFLLCGMLIQALLYL